MTEARAFAPASVGNVGVGFDILGHVIAGVGDTVTVRRIEAPEVRIVAIRGTTVDLPLDAPSNTAGAALIALREALALPFGFEVEIDKGIALGSGMGGSAASCVAALVARELDIPIVVLSQLSRRVEQRENKRPILSDLAESGSIEAEADLVTFLFRPAYYQQREAREKAAQQGETPPPEAAEDMDTPDQAEIIIAKHRNGPVGTVDVVFDKKYRVFADIDPYA